jgi:hypothetical protein
VKIHSTNGLTSLYKLSVLQLVVSHSFFYTDKVKVCWVYEPFTAFRSILLAVSYQLLPFPDHFVEQL